MRPTLTSRHTMAMLMAAARSVNNLSLRILLHLLLLAIASRYMSAKVWPEVPSETLWKTRVWSSKTLRRKSYWMSLRQSGTPSSFFRWRILLPEYTEETLPLALRRVVVVVAVYMGCSSAGLDLGSSVVSWSSWVGWPASALTGVGASGMSWLGGSAARTCRRLFLGSGSSDRGAEVVEGCDMMGFRC